MRENMKKNPIRSFHFDCTYKCVTPTPNKYRLLVLSGYDNLGNSIMLFYSLLRWKKITFESIFNVLKKEHIY
jgi:hypothetical protein